MPPDPDLDPAPGLVDFPALGRRLRRAATVVGAAVGVVALLDAVLNELALSRLMAWVGVFILCVVVADTVFVALHALSGAERAQKRGERLAADDVGLLPRRRGRASDPSSS